jgi:hypothetical protein
MRISLKVFSLAFFLASLAIGPQAFAHGPAGHQEHTAAAVDEQAMKAQHERMGSFKAAMSGLLEAVVDGNGSGARDQAARLTGALAGYEKDVPHKNVARIKEFKGLYAELKKRIDTLSGQTGSGGIPKIAAAYGRVLESCAACHARFRD